MAGRIPYLSKKHSIEAELFKLARATPLRLVTYRDFGMRVGVPTQGPWKPVLDLIADEQAAQGSPDLTYLVVSKRTGYPSQIGRKPARPPSPSQKAMAKLEGQKIVNAYNRRATNPF